MSDLHGDAGPGTERLRGALQSAAADLALDPIDPSAVRHRAATRRRRRRVALGGGAAVVAVTLVGSVVANRDNGDDTIEFSEPTETTPTIEAGDESAPTRTPSAVTTPITTPPTLPPVDAETGSAVEFAEAVSTSPTGDFMNLLPWQDGFLRIGYQYESQPLGPIPEEIAALFPEEVVALFPDGLPPTIDEATEVLTEAGLLDEVTAVLAEHPEASEVIYENDPPPPTLEANFTTDGAAWSTVELNPPIDGLGQFLVEGERLIAWSADGWNPDPTATSKELVVAWTDDLVDWESTSVPLEVDTPASEYLHGDVYVGSVAVLGEQWLARVERNVSTDLEALLPDDLGDEVRYSDFGYGISTDDDGLRVDVEQADGPATTYEFSWAELGLDGNPEPTDDERPQGSMVLGSFDGTFDEFPVPDDQQYGPTYATDDEFLLIGDGVLASSDGIDWSALDGLPTDEYVNGVVDLQDSVLFVTDGQDGPAGWIQARDGSFSPATLPKLPARYGLWNSTGSAAWVVDVSESTGGETWEPITATIEHEGFTLSMTDGPDGTAYTLVDDTGAVLREETLDPERRNDLIDIDPATGEYSVVVRDEDGSELVRIPGELLDAAVEKAYGGVEYQTSAEPAVEWNPDLWLIATANGIDWLTVDLDDPSPDGGYWTQGAAVNDGSVLYQTTDGWVLAELPTGG